MIFCHIGNSLSLCDITNGMPSTGGKLNHMGIGSEMGRCGNIYTSGSMIIGVGRHVEGRLPEWETAASTCSIPV